jgi:hypothetical protein
MAWDRVHTVNDYYDGPRLGIADVDRVPHIYMRLSSTIVLKNLATHTSLRLLTTTFWRSFWKSGRFGCAGIQLLNRARRLSRHIRRCLKIAIDMRLSKSPSISSPTSKHMTVSRLWNGAPLTPKLKLVVTEPSASVFSTFPTCPSGLTMSVHRGRPEVAEPRSKRCD